MNDSQDLTERLSSVLSELRELIGARRDQIEQLRSQIVIIENANEDLEKKIQEILNEF
tara:strand:- start:129 stop:302 length:174 start_codon:yes stop_codon:yes gene_type:complete